MTSSKNNRHLKSLRVTVFWKRNPPRRLSCDRWKVRCGGISIKNCFIRYFYVSTIRTSHISDNDTKIIHFFHLSRGFEQFFLFFIQNCWIEYKNGGSVIRNRDGNLWFCELIHDHKCGRTRTIRIVDKRYVPKIYLKIQIIAVFGG